MSKAVTSFRQLDELLKKEGYPRDEQMVRNNIYIAPLRWFYVEPGYNLRTVDLDHAEQFARSYERGAYVPPIVAELRNIDGEPRLVLRDGHHRVKGAEIAEARGARLPGLMVVEFKGNAADAVSMMIKTSEGKPLTPIQKAEGFKRLAGQLWSEKQIADQHNMSVELVERYLLLANADENLKQLVRDDKVTATVAIDVIKACRANGTDALQTLLSMREDAAKNGRARPTAKEASKALGKFKITPTQAVKTFATLQCIETPLREQLQAGGRVSIPLELEADDAKYLLELLQKYRETTTNKAA